MSGMRSHSPSGAFSCDDLLLEQQAGRRRSRSAPGGGGRLAARRRGRVARWVSTALGPEPVGERRAAATARRRCTRGRARRAPGQDTATPERSSPATEHAAPRYPGARKIPCLSPFPTRVGTDRPLLERNVVFSCRRPPRLRVHRRAGGPHHALPRHQRHRPGGSKPDSVVQTAFGTSPGGDGLLHPRRQGAPVRRRRHHGHGDRSARLPLVARRHEAPGARGRRHDRERHQPADRAGRESCSATPTVAAPNQCGPIPRPRGGLVTRGPQQQRLRDYLDRANQEELRGAARQWSRGPEPAADDQRPARPDVGRHGDAATTRSSRARPPTRPGCRSSPRPGR